jgi:rhamnulokinase
VKQNEETTDHRPLTTDHLFISVDLGAGSGRVFLCSIATDEFFLEEISRFHYPPTEENGFLRWDFPHIFAEIKKGLRAAGERAGALNRRIYSIGVDSWAVDYGLLDEKGELLADPFCYRDNRTDNTPEKVFQKISRAKIFENTGIQFLNFNTIYQLFSEDETIEKSDKLLLLHDLINFFLTGKKAVEYTNATTTQLVNAQTKTWDLEIIEKLNFSRNLFPEIIEAGTDLGFLEPEIAEALHLENVRVIAPATHDTGSAIIGAPLEENQAYISSGTWSLVGVERREVLINERVAAENFTNEGGAFGTIRFLKNVMGLWIFETCRREWQAQGIETDYEALLCEVAEIKEFQGFIFPDDKRFLNPPKMLEAIEIQMRETGQSFSENPAIITKIILDSLAFRYASVLRTIEKLTEEKISGLQIVGGGGRNEYLNQMTANAGGLMVKAGLTEATVTGNALVQAIAVGRFASLEEARRCVAANVQLKEFVPQKSSEFVGAHHRYAEIEAFYVKKLVVERI